MKPVILIGGGTSIREPWLNGLFDKLKQKDVEIWSLNFAYKTMPYLPDRQLFIDKYFFDENINELQVLHDQGVPITCKAHVKFCYLTQIEQFKTTRIAGQYYGTNAINKGLLFTGGKGITGFFALSYAVAKGYKEIYLLGYDFGPPNITDTDTHFYQPEIGKYKIRSRGVSKPLAYYDKTENRIKKEYLQDWEVYNQHKDIQIWNVSIQSNIPAFPKITYEDMYARFPARIENSNSS